MNSNLLAHLIVTGMFVAFVTIMLLLSQDTRVQAVALGLIPLLIGWWAPSPVQLALREKEIAPNI